MNLSHAPISTFNLGGLATPRFLFNVTHDQRPADQCDCACANATIDYADSRRILLLPENRYFTTPGTRVMQLTRDWFIASQPLSQIIPIVVNESSKRLLTFFGALRGLDEVYATFTCWEREVLADAILKMLATGLITCQGPDPIRLESISSTLTVWIHMTNACNLRCSYCYLNKNSESMSIETGRQAVDAIVRSARHHQYAGVKLKYAGGEATIKFPLIFQLHDYAVTLAERNQLTLDEIVLSNGTLLTEESIKRLKASRIRLMISLDGINEYHDAQRKFVSGRGSFALVARNIDLALQYGLVPDISITVSDRNLDGLPDTVKYILDRDLPFSLNFYRENDCSMSIENLRSTEQRIIDAMLKTYKVIEENLPRRSLLGSLVDRASFIAPHDHTCGVGHDYMVIDQHGRIAKCQMEITKTVTDICADDPLQLIRADQIGIQNKSVEEKESCRDCEWKYWCAGGCPLATRRATGRYDVKSPNCNIYKALYPEVLRLEGLRLLKYYSHEKPS